MSVEIQGLDGLLDRLDGIANPQKMERAVKTSCALVERSAKQKATKGSTGDLAKFIQYKVEHIGDVIEGVVFNPLEYAPFVEFGTGIYATKEHGPPGWWVYVKDGGQSGNGPAKRYTEQEAKRIVAMMRADGLEAYCTEGNQPQPFLHPALNENRETIIRILKGALIND